jgi:hypothetical protein
MPRNLMVIKSMNQEQVCKFAEPNKIYEASLRRPFVDHKFLEHILQNWKTLQGTQYWDVASDLVIGEEVRQVLERGRISTNTQSLG